MMSQWLRRCRSSTWASCLAVVRRSTLCSSSAPPTPPPPPTSVASPAVAALHARAISRQSLLPVYHRRFLTTTRAKGSKRTTSSRDTTSTTSTTSSTTSAATITRHVVDGKAVSGEILSRVQDALHEHREHARVMHGCELERAGLVVVMVDANQESRSYVRLKQQACFRVGLLSHCIDFRIVPSTTTGANSNVASNTDRSAVSTWFSRSGKIGRAHV